MWLGYGISPFLKNVIEIITFFNFASTTDTTQNWTIKLPTGKTIRIWWGDGNYDDYNGNGATSIAVTHTYAGSGTYAIQFSGDYLDLTYFQCNGNSLTANINIFTGFTGLKEIYIHENIFTGDVSVLASNTGLTQVYIKQNTSLSGDVSSFRVLTSMATLSAHSAAFDFDTTTSWTGVNSTIYLHDNGLTATQVDNSLIAFSGGSFSNKTITLNGTNAARTSASDAAVTTLEAAGNTIITTA